MSRPSDSWTILKAYCLVIVMSSSSVGPRKIRQLTVLCCCCRCLFCNINYCHLMTSIHDNNYIQLVYTVEGVGGAFSQVPGAVLQCHVHTGAWIRGWIGWTDGGHVVYRCVACRLNRQQWSRPWTTSAEHRYQLCTETAWVISIFQHFSILVRVMALPDSVAGGSVLLACLFVRLFMQDSLNTICYTVLSYGFSPSFQHWCTFRIRIDKCFWFLDQKVKVQSSDGMT